MKRILLIASEFASGMIPFAATVINCLAETKHFKVKCICVNSGKARYDGLICPAANPVFIEFPHSKLKKITYKFWPSKIINSIKKATDDFNPDYIHFLTVEFSLALFVKLNKNLNIRYTVHDLHPHECESKGLLGKLFVKYIFWGVRSIIRDTHHLTTSSMAQVNEIKSLWPDKNVAYTPFPTLINEKIKDGGMPVPELGEISNYILFFGNVEKYKGVELLIESFKQSKISSEYKLVIAGRGPLSDESLTDHPNIIRLNRFIHDAELKQLFSNAIFVVYPYISATMSGVLSLAYYFGKNVLVSDVPFFRQYRNDLTVFFHTGDSDDLRNKLEKMLAAPSFAENPHEIYNQTYSPIELVNAYKNFYGD